LKVWEEEEATLANRSAGQQLLQEGTQRNILSHFDGVTWRESPVGDEENLNGSSFEEFLRGFQIIPEQVMGAIQTLQIYITLIHQQNQSSKRKALRGKTELHRRRI